MMKLDFQKATCRVEFDYYLKGSVLQGSVASGCTAVRTHFQVESGAPEADIVRLIRTAKQGCFAENMVQQPVPLTSTIELNGQPVKLEGVTG